MASGNEEKATIVVGIEELLKSNTPVAKANMETLVEKWNATPWGATGFDAALAERFYEARRQIRARR